MREKDRAEMLLCAQARAGQQAPEWPALADELRKAWHPGWWSMWENDRFLGVGGVEKLPTPGAGAIWFLGTTAADTKWISMTVACGRFITMERRHWSWLGNVVPIRHGRRKRWLRRLGFDIHPEEANLASHGLVAFSLQSEAGPEIAPAAP